MSLFFLVTYTFDNVTLCGGIVQAAKFVT